MAPAGVYSFKNIPNNIVVNLRTKMRSNLCIPNAVFVVKLFIFHGYKGKPAGPLFSYTSFQACKSDQLSESFHCVFSKLTKQFAIFDFFIFCIERCTCNSFKISYLGFLAASSTNNNLLCFLIHRFKGSTNALTPRFRGLLLAFPALDFHVRICRFAPPLPAHEP